MTPDQIGLIQKSFAKIAPIAPLLVDLFYSRLFAEAPDLRPLFPADLTAQKIKLIDTLATFVLYLHQLETVRPKLEALGHRHLAYGARAEHYELVGAALIATLAVGLGPDFTPELRAAWVAGYAILAGMMIPAPPHPGS